jgi:glycosyltransferase involved in cell wall biosynthesis
MSLTEQILSKPIRVLFFILFLLNFYSLWGQITEGSKATVFEKAIGLISSKGSAERVKARLKRSGLNEEGMAIAMPDEEDRSGEAVAGRTLDEIKPITFENRFDLTIVGKANFADGLGRIPIGIIDLFMNEIDINFIPLSKNFNLSDVSPEVKSIVSHPKKAVGNVSILTEALWYVNIPNYSSVPPSKIKIAYSMMETTAIPLQWVEILNKHFDVVVVPDSFLVDIYKDSGVTIPIFELPLGVYLDKYLAQSHQQRLEKPFVFGSTVSCDERKNSLLVVQAFAEEFGNSDKVILKLNSRTQRGGMITKCKILIKSLGVNNIIITNQVMDETQYIEFMDSMDCFINISKGEGFSITPREALALGLPCILSNNTAQKTLCESGFVRAVPSEIQEDALHFYSRFFGHQPVGVFFNCKVQDVREAMRDVYENYNFYLNKAAEGREWVTRYRWPNLKLKYLNLIKPQKVVLGSENVITDDYLMTNSVDLYRKYSQL